MLNRRILRFKALKALYAYRKARDANQLWVAERMKADFEPDWLAKTPPDIKALEAAYEEARRSFLEITCREGQPQANIAPSSAKAKQAVRQAFQFYEGQIEKDRQRIRRQMLEEAEGIYKTYLLMLQLLCDLATYAETDAENRKKRVYDREPVYENEYKLSRNQWIQKLRKLEQFERLRQQYAPKWDEGLLREWYGKLREQEWYQEYCALPEADYAQDWQAVDDIVRKFIFAHEAVVEHFEERDLQWVENRPILRNMLLRTLKNAKTEAKELELQPLARNWENDKFFFEELFDQTVAHEIEHDELIRERLKNWELDRVALTDRLILQLALTELFYFQSIPTKVTINEYVELTKKYSPPKSREFVNGLLDRLTQALVAEGKIRKSGRGLIDNR